MDEATGPGVVTADDVGLYTIASTVLLDSPIHTEPSVAKAAGLPDMILYGSATKAMSLTAVVDECFDGDAMRITRLCGQLRGMVSMDTVIAVEGLAEEVIDGEKRILFRTLNAEGRPAVSNGVVCGRV